MYLLSKAAREAETFRIRELANCLGLCFANCLFAYCCCCRWWCCCRLLFVVCCLLSVVVLVVVVVVVVLLFRHPEQSVGVFTSVITAVVLVFSIIFWLPLPMMMFTTVMSIAIGTKSKLITAYFGNVDARCS